MKANKFDKLFVLDQVRTRRFPSEVDTQATFIEISERLRDPEWEVRQHALRVLMDVLPTLSTDVVDKVMQPVVPELINNLGHPAPAVRKGALDTLRVYLVHSPNREDMVQNVSVCNLFFITCSFLLNIYLSSFWIYVYHLSGKIVFLQLIGTYQSIIS